ncbi:MAG: N-acetylmuramic acid 6-phosphate etherase [Proteobacteria bacterium]|nr:N-acetylmuramic acid 6-phosphate etherase [Pseudomonadota bacterium]
MPTEGISARYADVDLWPTRDAVAAMLEGQLAAAAAVAAQADPLAAAAEAAAARLADPAGRLVYVGAGASGRIAVQDGVELGPTYDWPSERLVYALAGGTGALNSSAEGAEDDAQQGMAAMRQAALGSADVVIGVAASGATPYTVAAVREAASAGALTVGLSSNAAAVLLQAAAHPILLETGPEIVAGSTRMKAGTAQKIALNVLSTAIMLRLGRVYKGLMVDMRVSNRKLRDRAVGMVGEISRIDRAAAENALEQAGGDIKLAALLGLGLEPRRAADLLREAGHNLRVAMSRMAGGD